ncbi:MAG TPA: zinc ribbon domain-containing protein [Candidatus Limnocylindria bacterium]|nr:zinc ribbon domain-containing protein [Candidatus Limnocylindria bacterium]
MELIRDLIEWVANDSGSAVATIFPYLLLGLVGLYLLWLVIGYLRVSQVGVAERGPEPVVALPRPADAEAPLDRPRGVPYCAFDGLQYPAGARFCTACERDLLLDCVNCGATLAASDASCFRCGTPTSVANDTLLS